MTDQRDPLPGLDQAAYGVRLEWGPTGAAEVTADVAVVVDVLSFTTTLSVAVEKGIEVFPFRWRDARATEHAVRHGATLAVGRFEARALRDSRHVSLSPAGLLEADGLERLVLPSPNGSTIAFGLADSGARVVGASLRNADAVARWVADQLVGDLARASSVVVVAAGERWPDDTLRPAVEDLWGAGAVLAGLVEAGVTGLSPEARTAVAAWEAVRDGVGEQLAACASGRELVERGFADDVAVSGRVAVSDVVPVLVGDRFVAG